MKSFFLDIDTTKRIKLDSILEKLTQRHNRRESARFDMSQDDCDNQVCVSTQFMQIQKNQSIHLQESLDHFCNALPVFGINSAKYHLNLIKSYSLPILVNERDNEPTVIKRTKQLIPLKFGVFQLLDIMNFLGGATNFDSFLMAYKTSETKRFCP